MYFRCLLEQFHISYAKETKILNWKGSNEGKIFLKIYPLWQSLVKMLKVKVSIFRSYVACMMVCRETAGIDILSLSTSTVQVSTSEQVIYPLRVPIVKVPSQGEFYPKQNSS